MKVPAIAKRTLIPAGKAFLIDRTKTWLQLIIIYKEVLEDGSTKEKSIKGKKR